MKTSICSVAIFLMTIIGGFTSDTRLSEQAAIATARPFLQAWRGNHPFYREVVSNALFLPEKKVWQVWFFGGAVHSDTFVLVHDLTGKATVLGNDGTAIDASHRRDLFDPKTFFSLSEFRKALARQRAKQR